MMTLFCETLKIGLGGLLKISPDLMLVLVKILNLILIISNFYKLFCHSIARNSHSFCPNCPTLTKIRPKCLKTTTKLQVKCNLLGQITTKLQLLCKLRLKRNVSIVN